MDIEARLTALETRSRRLRSRVALLGFAWAGTLALWLAGCDLRPAVLRAGQLVLESDEGGWVRLAADGATSRLELGRTAEGEPRLAWIVSGDGEVRRIGVEAVDREAAEQARRIALAEARCREYYDAGRLLATMRKDYPATLEDLLKPLSPGGDPLYDQVDDDPWGKPYRLVPLQGRAFRIESAGPDGRFGTDDDVRWPLAR